MKLHVTAADAVKAPVNHVMADFEDACRTNSRAIRAAR